VIHLPARCITDQKQAPQTMGSLAILVYVAFAVSILWSALRHRRDGWIAGFIFAILLLTIPLWVAGLIWTFGALPE
jgi:hypothetical protein